MSDYASARDRLLNHAGLPQRSAGAKDGESLLHQLYLADRRNSPPDLGLFDDVVQCLFAVNTRFNGPDPDRRLAGAEAEEPIPRELDYAVTIIVCACIRHHRRWASRGWCPADVLEGLLEGAHRVSFAWQQVLAGDVTGLEEGFDFELE